MPITRCRYLISAASTNVPVLTETVFLSVRSPHPSVPSGHLIHRRTFPAPQVGQVGLPCHLRSS